MPENEKSEVIYSYTTEQAVEDGILFKYGIVTWGENSAKIYVTTNLFVSELDEDPNKLKPLIKQGLDLLLKPDPEDMPHMRLRVIKPDRIWVISEPGKVTFLMPEDY